QIIEYTELIPIFDVLNSELHQNVFNAMGQKALYSKPVKFYNTNMSLSKQTDYGTDHDFEEFIEKLLNQNGIHANVVSYKQEDNRIYIIAIFNKQIILIKCKTTGKPIDANIIKNFQALIYQFGEPILSIIVYNSEKLKNFNYPLTIDVKLWWKTVCPEIQIASEKMIAT
ncbi:22599_t:CDS:1, partial [Gigaspora margarita]